MVGLKERAVLVGVTVLELGLEVAVDAPAEEASMRQASWSQRWLAPVPSGTLPKNCWFQRRAVKRLVVSLYFASRK